MLEDGATVPASQTRIPVDLDQFSNIFDEETREGAQKNLRGFGDAFASAARRPQPDDPGGAALPRATSSR